MMKCDDIPAGVNKRGNREKIPATLAMTKVRKYACLSAASKLPSGFVKHHTIRDS